MRMIDSSSDLRGPARNSILRLGTPRILLCGQILDLLVRGGCFTERGLLGRVWVGIGQSINQAFRIL